MRQIVWVKICGTTSLEDALLAVEAGADALGFIFAESLRRIAPEVAAEIIHRLPEGVEKVGVFVNESAEGIAEIVRQVGLTGVQLHEDETGEVERGLTQQDFGSRSLRVINVVSMHRAREMLRSGPAVIKAKPGDTILLDSGTPAQRGGTGRTWDWGFGKNLIAVFAGKVNVIVAGGLTATNVAAAIATLHPWGVDVVSGVERQPGKKDPEKVRAFVKAAKQENL